MIFVSLREATIASLDSLTSHTKDNCTILRNNMTEEKISDSKVATLENCLYYYLVDREAKISDFGHNLFLQPPGETNIKVKIVKFLVHQVDLQEKSSSTFHIHGDLYIKWNDSRLKWNSTEWKFVGKGNGTSFALHDLHNIWTPSFTDESYCSIKEGCMSAIDDIEISSDGDVSARLTFRYPAYCSIDYYRYPEETNDCCLFLSYAETERTTEFDVSTEYKKEINKPVAITKVEKDITDQKTILMNVETSVWKAQDQTIDTVKIAGWRTEFLRLCVHSRKEMSTLKVALRIPVTIATMLIKWVRWNQTKNFFLSVVVTLVALGLSRLKRNVPPSHTLYLAAKLVNRYVCCVEPETSTSYQRYIDDTCTEGGRQTSSTDAPDYTTEWRHIYIAFNNLFSGLSFTLFIFTIIFDIL
uniref:Neurotransmitter-gated ion-channel ligand-binding domain-containing protein n=1 Tax=Acrobeloides nanus TaxID=290746 RepID=A0A914DTX8_9BILA